MESFLLIDFLFTCPIETDGCQKTFVTNQVEDFFIVENKAKATSLAASEMGTVITLTENKI